MISRFALHQLDRARVLLSRIIIGVSPSPAVDYHTLSILLRHLSDSDMSFLQHALGPRMIDLDELPRDGAPSFFRKVLWILALEAKWPQAVVRQVEYKLGQDSFLMSLDLSLAPECTYYVEDPTPALTRLLRLGGRVFYDVGANVGFHTMTSALFFQESHGFEPTPSTLVRLRANASLNPSRPIKIHEVALSSHSGVLRFKTSRTHPGGNTVVTTAQTSEHTIEIPAFTLDSYCQAQGLEPPDLIKIDVEGHETEVLRGAENTVTAHRPSLFVELLTTESLRIFLSFLPQGYLAYHLKAKGTPLPVVPEKLNTVPTDILFVDSSRRALINKLIASA